MNTPLKLSALALLVTLNTGCIIHIDGQGDVDLESGFSYDNRDVSKVNGDIEIAEHRVVKDIDSVNGNITLEQHASSRDIDVVNGDVLLKSHANSRDVSTVNGNVSARSEVKVEGDISTVNGDITLVETQVSGDISTVNGDISLNDRSVVFGDIIFETNKSMWGNKKRTPPTLSIGADVTLEGRIILKQPVTLKLANPAHQQKVERDY